jgi:hypothetical protein
VHDQPDAAEILRTVGEFLADELLPTLDDALAYRTRVAVNLVTILERQVRLGPTHEARERALLVDLVGQGDDLEGLNAALCRLLDEHPIPDADFDRRVWAALRAVAEDKLAIARPGYGVSAPAPR